MGKRLSFLLVVLALLSSVQPVDSQEFPFAGVDAYQALLRAGYTTLEGFAALLVPSKIPLLADGGGDGGGGSGDGGGGSGDGGGSGTGGGTGDGGSGADAAGAAGAGAAGGAGDGTGGAGTGGTGDGTGGTGDGTGGNGDGTGDSSSAADAAAATSDAAATDASATDASATDAAATDAAATDAAAAAATDAAATDASAAADAAATDAATTNAAAADNAAADNTSVTAPPTDPTNNANAVVTNPTNPTPVNNAVTPELAAIMSIPTTDPRGGEGVVRTVNSGVPGGAAPALGGPGAAPVDVAFNAVIVSAAQSPWDAIRRAPGVRNIIVTGGIIALGKTPIPGEIPGGGPQPAWLRLIPDLRLLNGSAIPPVVPNVIDVRIMNCPIKIEND